MRIKKGVEVFGMRPEMMFAVAVADSVIHEVQGHGATITSVMDGKHGSIVHSVGCGVDIRTRNDKAGAGQWSLELKKRVHSMIVDRLNDEFDVVLESDHIHIELDRR